MLQALEVTLTCGALVVGVLFLRHAQAGGSAFRWLGAGYLLYVLNDILTSFLPRAFPIIRDRQTTVYLLAQVPALVVATLALTTLFIGLHLHDFPDRESTPGLRTFLGSWALVAGLLFGLRALDPRLVQATPAAILGYGAYHQFRLAQQRPGRGHLGASLALAAHPAMWIGLVLAGTPLLLTRDLLSIPYVAAGIAVLSTTLQRLHQELQSLNRDLEQRLAQREQAIVDAQRQLLQAAVAQSRHDERTRLLTDLHDGIGAQLAQARLRAEQGSLAPAEMCSLLDACVTDLHLVVDTVLHADGHIGHALRFLRHRLAARQGTDAARLLWDIKTDDVPQLPPTVVLQLMRFTQEAVANALTHAQARHIRVTAARDVPAATLSVAVVDDGVGLPPAAAVGTGLRTLRQLTARVEGHLQVRDASPGTAVTVRVPIPPD